MKYRKSGRNLQLRIKCVDCGQVNCLEFFKRKPPENFICSCGQKNAVIKVKNGEYKTYIPINKYKCINYLNEKIWINK